MITTELYQESGFGNQIWKAMVLRSIAKNKGYNFGIMGKDSYKGKNIIDLDFGKDVNLDHVSQFYQEKLIRNSRGIDISPADQNIIDIPDNTRIDGNLQAISYIKENRQDIIEWMKIKEEKVNTKFSDDNVCVVSIRGGDYVGSPADSFLRIEYYLRSMKYMRDINKDMKFVIVSDDIRVVERYCECIGKMVGSLLSRKPDPLKSDYHLGGDISIDYAILNSAKNIILSNSTFSWWAAWTNTYLKNIIAPYGWFSHNLEGDYWSTADMKVDEWTYIDREGNLR